MKCLDCGANKSKNGLYCKKCGYKHRVRPTGLKYKIVVQNKGWFIKGQQVWNKGVPSIFRKENPGYDAIHEWINRWLNKSKTCEKCNSEKNVEWANKSGLYLRDFLDWMRLCKKCHTRYDYEKFGARQVFFT